MSSNVEGDFHPGEKSSSGGGGVGSKLPIIAAVVITAIAVTVICVPLTYYLHPDYIDADSEPSNQCPPSGEPASVSPETTPTAQPTAPLDPENQRFDCWPDRETGDQSKCETRGCTWDAPESTGPPACFFPEDYEAYSVTEFLTEDWGYRVKLGLNSNAPIFLEGGVEALWLDVEIQTKSRLHFKIYDPDNQRFEVPHKSLPPTPTEMAEGPLYHVEFDTESPSFSFKVRRTDSGTVVFDTSVGALIFEDQFLQLSTLLPSHNVYGFGEHEHESFRHDLNWKRWGSFSRDQPPGGDANLYGTHPFYLCLENDANAHGVFINNANAQDVSLQPTPALTFRHIGGVFDFYMFFGPTPEDVVSQYTEVIGRPYLPPYWGLGFHLSRYGYNSIENVRAVVDRMRQYNIPHDVQYGDIDYMERQLDFTIDEEAYGEANLKAFVEELDAEGTSYIIILDPAISGNETAGTYRPFDNGARDDVFINDADGGILYGKVWPDYPGIEVDSSQPWDYQTENYRAYAAFPDFQRSQTKEWWKREILDFHDRIPFDGIWIDMNEPASFVVGSVEGCSDNKYDFPPYIPKIWGATMADKTICMNSVQNLDETDTTVHYNMHSLFGWSQSEPTLIAAQEATGQRSLVITRSTFPGSGKYGGHWLGDNTSIWPHIHKSIIEPLSSPLNIINNIKDDRQVTNRNQILTDVHLIFPGMLEFNLFGIPFFSPATQRNHSEGELAANNGMWGIPNHAGGIGADICGFFQDTTEELCRRWSQIGNFYTFARNHNGLNYMDQDPASFGEAFAIEMRDLFAIRYTLLPYLYTLHYKATAHGHTVIRSLMHEFTSDENTWAIDRQFLWGPGFMITPVLDEGATSVDAYIPNARWYDWYTGKEVSSSLAGSWVTLEAPASHINLHVRGGSILPTQEPANSTQFSRENPFGLVVALSEGQSAVGTLFWDDGRSIDTIASKEYYLIEYMAAEGQLLAAIVDSFGSLLDNHRLDTINIYGMIERPPWVKLNGVEILDSQWEYNDGFSILTISDLQQPMAEPFILSWK